MSGASTLELPVSLFDGLRRTIRDHPELGIQLIDNRGRPAGRRSFGEQVEAARSMARRYRALGIAPGDRVLVSLGTSWEWLDAWFGALWAGALPVAIAPPGALGSPAAQIEKTLRVAHRVGARVLVCTDAVLREAERALAGGLAERALEGPLATELVEIGRLLATPPGPPVPEPDAAPEDVAFLQLTSGSTGLPRAVQISHGSAVHNPIAITSKIIEVHDRRPVGAMVCWLPLYHDMGLIGCVINAMVNGIPLELLNPRSFLARPWIWLERAAAWPDVMSPAPNFGYQLCCERAAGRIPADLDLSGFRDAMTGSEMVRPETCELFLETFRPHGFRRSQLRACYGLAEATLAVTVDSQLEGARTRPVPAGAEVLLAGSAAGLAEVVSNGTPIPDTRVEIRDPAGRPQPAGRIGELWIAGPGLMSGYDRDPAATAETLQDGWLDSGDLGFLDEAGELYLVGRSKEILILRGQNLMPHELEWVADGICGTGGTSRAAAFSVPGADGERAVMVLESEAGDAETLERLRREVAGAIGRTLAIPLADLVLVRRGTIPRTSSGKLQRSALRESYLRGEVARLDDP
ncbi:MAG TPA: AMP-binding protein [Thermoanaerobaculia bacterium]|nr:AMP-binding protein [Thermoanaerobaculia bacterium]